MSDLAALGEEMYQLVAELYPIPRSITGDGVRDTLRAIAKRVPLTVHEVPTGTQVLDWTIPREWNIRDAWIKNMRGERVVDFRASTLHVVGYSTPVRATMTLPELRPHLHTLRAHPHWIPYRTSYYVEDWGFCLSASALAALEDGEYEVVIDATLEAGALTYGEYLVPGRETNEVLISAHVCHPSLANDNLSGVALAVALARHVETLAPRYSYRFLFAPGTIGAIAWLARNEARAARIRHGLVLACVGDPGPFTYKRSRRGDTEIDRAVAHVLGHGGMPHRIVDFSPYGYDERQFNSPGFDLPVGAFSRSAHGTFPEYHTSADDLDLVRPRSLAESFARCAEVIEVLEGNRVYVNTQPRGEPQLGRRGLYRAMGGPGGGELAMLWVLNQSDGRHALLDVAERAGAPFGDVRIAADRLGERGLLVAAPAPGTAGRDGQELAGRVALVTGAGGGIGGAIAAALGARGARVWLVGRSRSRLDDTAGAFASPDDAVVHVADITVDDEVARLRTRLESEAGQLDILVHAAGIIEPGDVDTGSPGAMDAQYRTNTRAPYVLTRALLPLLRARRGQIVFVNSTSGLRARRGQSGYAASKHALRALADSVRDEVNADGVRVLSVFPGRTATPMQATVHAAEGRPYHPERLVQPEDVAAMVMAALTLPATAEVTEIRIRPLSKST